MLDTHSISYHAHANNTLLLVHNIEELNTALKILQSYSDASGQQLNKTKSSILLKETDTQFTNVPMEEAEEDRYLGI